MRNKILVLGSSNVDIIIRVPRFPEPGETITGENLVTAFGGKGANQAIAARRLGGSVRLVTKLGVDYFGRTYRQYLVRSRIDPRYLLRDPRVPTGTALIEVGPRGENRIVVSRGSNESLSPKDVANTAGAWKGTRVFMAQLEIPLPTVIAGLNMARKNGALTLLNPSPAVALTAEIVSLVDFIVPNEREAERLTGINFRRRGDLSGIAGRLLNKGAGNVVITLGRRGVFFKNREEEIYLHAFPVAAIDTTAAGDAFMGALACGLAEGKPLREILRMANAAGALASTRLGAQPSLPDRRSLNKFLAAASSD